MMTPPSTSGDIRGYALPLGLLILSTSTHLHRSLTCCAALARLGGRPSLVRGPDVFLPSPTITDIQAGRQLTQGGA
jgi:hypothetical protein